MSSTVPGSGGVEPTKVPPAVPVKPAAPAKGAPKKQAAGIAAGKDTIAPYKGAASTKAQMRNLVADAMNSYYVSSPKTPAPGTGSGGGGFVFPGPGLAYYAAEVMMEDIQAWNQLQQAYGQMEIVQFQQIAAQGLSAASSESAAITAQATQSLWSGLGSLAGGIGGFGFLVGGIMKTGALSNQEQELTLANKDLEASLFSKPSITIESEESAVSSLSSPKGEQEIELDVLSKNDKALQEETSRKLQSDDNAAITAKSTKMAMIEKQNAAMTTIESKESLAQTKLSAAKQQLNDAETNINSINNKYESLLSKPGITDEERIELETQRDLELSPAQKDLETAQAEVNGAQKDLDAVKAEKTKLQQANIAEQKQFDDNVRKQIDVNETKISNVKKDMQRITEKMTQYAQSLQQVSSGASTIAASTQTTLQAAYTLEKGQASVQQQLANLLYSQDEKGFSDSVQQAEAEMQSLQSLMQAAAQSVERQV